MRYLACCVTKVTALLAGTVSLKCETRMELVHLAAIIPSFPCCCRNFALAITPSWAETIQFNVIQAYLSTEENRNLISGLIDPTEEVFLSPDSNSACLGRGGVVKRDSNLIHLFGSEL